MSFEATVRSTGVCYLGECDGLVWFLDPVTQSTHTLPLEEVSPENIQTVLYRSREVFARKSAFLHPAVSLRH